MCGHFEDKVKGHRILGPSSVGPLQSLLGRRTPSCPVQFRQPFTHLEADIHLRLRLQLYLLGLGIGVTLWPIPE